MKNDPETFEQFIQSVRGLFFALRGVSNEMLADFDCTAVERGALQDLDSERLTVPAMAKRRAVTRQAMQKTIDRLVEQGWVSAVANPLHMRSPLLELTPGGKRHFARIRAHERRVFASFPLPLRNAELRQASEVIETVERVLSTRSQA